jgi:hypothetical protein
LAVFVVETAAAVPAGPVAVATVGVRCAAVLEPLGVAGAAAECDVVVEVTCDVEGTGTAVEGVAMVLGAGAVEGAVATGELVVVGLVLMGVLAVVKAGLEVVALEAGAVVGVAGAGVTVLADSWVAGWVTVDARGSAGASEVVLQLGPALAVGGSCP